MANRVYKADRVHKDHLVIGVLMVPLVWTVQKVRREHRVILDPLDHKACPVPLDDRVTLVTMDNLAPQDNREKVEPQDHQDCLVRVAQGETQDRQVSQVLEVHKGDREGAASQDRWDLMVNKAPQDNVAHQVLSAQLDCLAKMEEQENQEIPVKMDLKEKGDLMVLVEKMVKLVQGDLQVHQVIQEAMEGMATRVREEKMVNQAKLDHRDLQDLMVAWEHLGKKENRVHLARQVQLDHLELKVLRVPPVILVSEERLDKQELMDLLA